MSRHVDAIARTLLYEGYLLYPYRRSAVKNRHRFNFGVLYPRDYCASEAATSLPDASSGGDRWFLQTECPVQGSGDTQLEVSVRYLQLMADAESDPGPAEQRAVELGVALVSATLGELSGSSRRRVFGDAVVSGDAEICAEEVRSGIYKVSVRVANAGRLDEAAPARESALLRSLVSAHVVLDVDGGSLVSLLDAPDDCRDVVGECQNLGVWPVLVGEPGSHACMLASPIVLYDYPQIAPESAGDLFDGTEIDEILALRILTLTDDEKREVRLGDARAREILERTESLPPEHWARLHGAVRGLRKVTAGTS